jgi:hypothetical protein
MKPPFFESIICPTFIVYSKPNKDLALRGSPALPNSFTGLKGFRPMMIDLFEIDLYLNFIKWWNVKFQAKYTTLLSEFLKVA